MGDTEKRGLGCLTRILVSLIVTVIFVLPSWFLVRKPYVVKAGFFVYPQVQKLLPEPEDAIINRSDYQRYKTTHGVMLLNNGSILSAIESTGHFRELIKNRFDSTDNVTSFSDIRKRLSVDDSENHQLLIVSMKCSKSEQVKTIEFVNALVEYYAEVIQHEGRSEQAKRIRTLKNELDDDKQELEGLMKWRVELAREYGILEPEGVSIEQKTLQQKLAHIVELTHDLTRQRMELEEELQRQKSFSSSYKDSENRNEDGVKLLELRIDQKKSREEKLEMQTQDVLEAIGNVSSIPPELALMDDEIEALRKVINRLTEEVQIAELESNVEKRRIEVAFMATEAESNPDNKKETLAIIFVAVAVFLVMLVLLSVRVWIRRLRSKNVVPDTNPA